MDFNTFAVVLWLLLLSWLLLGQCSHYPYLSSGRSCSWAPGSFPHKPCALWQLLCLPAQQEVPGPLLCFLSRPRNQHLSRDSWFLLVGNSILGTQCAHWAVYYFGLSHGFQTFSVNVWQDSKELGKFLDKWNGETETRKFNKAKELSNLQPAGESQDLISPNQGHLRVNGSYLSSLTREYRA